MRTKELAETRVFFDRTRKTDKPDTAVIAPATHRLPPLTKGLFDNLFRLDARRTGTTTSPLT